MQFAGVAKCKERGRARGWRSYGFYSPEQVRGVKKWRPNRIASQKTILWEMWVHTRGEGQTRTTRGSMGQPASSSIAVFFATDKLRKTVGSDRIDRSGNRRSVALLIPRRDALAPVCLCARSSRSIECIECIQCNVGEWLIACEGRGRRKAWTAIGWRGLQRQ